MLYKFGKYELDSARAELRVDGEAMKVESQVYALLEILVKNHDRVVSKNEINEHIWDGRIVSDGSLDNRISTARKTIGDDGKTQALIKTFTGRGFRFIGKVETKGEETALTPERVVPETVMPASEEEAPPPARLNSSPMPKPSLPWKGIAVGLVVFAGLAFIGLNLRGGETAAPEPASVAQSASTHKASIAVLPFTNMITQADDKYLGDGLSEEILNVLASIRELKVASRTSAFTFRDDKATIGEISEALGVDHVLEGSVRKSGDTLRVTAQLIEADGDKHLWSKTYDRVYSTENILQIQDDIAREISHRLVSELDLPPLTLAPPIKSLDAYQHYLRARELARENQPDSLEQAVEAYKTAIELEPHYIPAYEGLIDAYSNQHFYSGLSEEKVLQKMEAVLAQGYRIEPNAAGLHLAESRIAQRKKLYQKSLKLVDRALEINPHYVGALTHRATVLWQSVQYEESLKAYEEVLKYDSVTPSTLGNYAFANILYGDLDKAMEATRKNVKWNPGAVPGLNMMARLLRFQGKYVEAHQYLIDAAKINAAEYYVQFDLANLYLSLGLDDLALEASKSDGIRARTLAFLGRDEAAARLIDKDPDTWEAGYAAYILGDNISAYKVHSPAAKEHKLYILGTRIGKSQTDNLARIIYSFRQNNDPNAEIMLANLERYYGDRPPSEFQIPNEFLGGASLHMLKDDPDEALLWIDEAIDNGHVNLKLTRDPLFAPLKDHPGYKPRLKRMEELAKTYRAAIEKQL